MFSLRGSEYLVIFTPAVSLVPFLLLKTTGASCALCMQLCSERKPSVKTINLSKRSIPLKLHPASMGVGDNSHFSCMLTEENKLENWLSVPQGNVGELRGDCTHKTNRKGEREYAHFAGREDKAEDRKARLLGMAAGTSSRVV